MSNGNNGGGSSVSVVAIIAIIILVAIGAWFFLGRSGGSGTNAPQETTVEPPAPGGR